MEYGIGHVILMYNINVSVYVLLYLYTTTQYH